MFAQFDYYNSMLINTPDEEGNYVSLGSEFALEENEHFNKLLVNTQQSVIQVPTNVYNKGTLRKTNESKTVPLLRRKIKPDFSLSLQTRIF